MDDRFEHRTVMAGAQRIHLVEAGTGPMVVMAHGFPESWYSWRHQLGALADAGYRAVAVDMRGYGRSGQPPRIDDYRITELVADLVGVVAALGEQTAVVVGHDWGAPVAWTAAWTRPDVFTAVVGLSVPFGGRGLMALPTSPFGERRPSAVEREIAGADLLFYQEHFTIAPGNAEREFERDMRGWIEAALYSFSASPPLPPEVAAIDFAALPDEHLVLALRQTPLCFAPGEEMRGKMAPPPGGRLPGWYTQADVDHYVAEFERTGMTGGLNYYRCIDLDWELLAPYEGRPLAVPGLYIGGDRDVVTMWSGTAVRRFAEHAPQAREAVIVPDCGHWIQQEQPAAVNAALLEFLGGL
jgi:pimeloyl-ACP methyl ester carboxylesterase